MHLVHIKHGLEKSKIGYTSDSVAVIAVLVEVCTNFLIFFNVWTKYSSRQRICFDSLAVKDM